MPVFIQYPELNESSGICRSNLVPGAYYSHNDSGSAPTLYRFDEQGNALGKFPLSTKSVDAEDIGSAVVNGRPTLVIGDFGDNNCTRTTYKIIVVVEAEAETTLPVSLIPFSYPDGKKRNCEACFLLPSGKIVLVTKSYPAASGPTQIFTILSWLSGDSGTVVQPGPKLDTTMGVITAADINSSGTVVLMGNGKAYLFNEGFYGTRLKTITMPRDFQPEAICFNHAGDALLMTSETNRAVGGLTPLHRIAL